MRLHRAAEQAGSMRAAARQLGIAWASFWDDYHAETVANQATTQVPLNRGLVYEVDDCDLYLASDWHWGHESCYVPGVDMIIERVASDPKNRLILGGDQCEITPQGYHDGGRNSVAHIDEQIVSLTKMLMPIAGQIDLIHAGNHGKARLVQAGIDPDMMIASLLDAAYTPVPKVVQYRMPGGTVKVCTGHGKSAAQNSVLELRRMQMIYPGCDLYALGHDHSLFAEPVGALEYDADGKELWSGTWVCRTGSMLRLPEYARYAMYAPKPTGFLLARLRGGQIDTVEVIKV